MEFVCPKQAPPLKDGEEEGAEWDTDWGDEVDWEEFDQFEDFDEEDNGGKQGAKGKGAGR